MNDTSSLENHLNRIEGQIKGIRKMVTDDRHCSDVLQQIIAVRASLATVGKILLKQDINQCLKRQDGEEVASNINTLFKLS